MSQLTQVVPEQSAFHSASSFEHAQRVAKMLSSSNLVPEDYRGNIQNTMIALEIANRIGASPLMVMQNLYIIHGKPSWSSTFIIAAINSSNKFTPLRYEVSGVGDDYGCVAYAFEKGSDQRLESPRITIGMAKAEGWTTKKGSKWVTMMHLMLRYRAATLFGRLYAPEILMGMYTTDEVVDMQVEKPKPNKELERLKLFIEDCETIDQLSTIEYRTQDHPELTEIYQTKLNNLKTTKNESANTMQPDLPFND